MKNFESWHKYEESCQGQELSTLHSTCLFLVAIGDYKNAFPYSTSANLNQNKVMSIAPNWLHLWFQIWFHFKPSFFFWGGVKGWWCLMFKIMYTPCIILFSGMSPVSLGYITPFLCYCSFWVLIDSFKNICHPSLIYALNCYFYLFLSFFKL